MDPLLRITERVGRFGDLDDSETPRPLLSIDEFFEGNEVVGSIGCNCIDEPHPRVFYSLLQKIAQRAEVSDIRVQISLFDDPDWPFSDTIYIITTATPEEVASWFPEEVAPDDLSDGFSKNQSYEPYTIPTGYRAVACWWD